MKVILAKNSGFCPGVKRAVDTAKKIYGENVCILGEIIHNENVTDEIKKLGTKIVDGVDEVDRDTESERMFTTNSTIKKLKS